MERKVEHSHHYEHEAILRELRDNSQKLNSLTDTIRDGFDLFRTETQARHRETMQKFDEVWKHINEEKRRTDKALAIANQTRNVMWFVGGLVITANIVAIAKLVNLW